MENKIVLNGKEYEIGEELANKLLEEIKKKDTKNDHKRVGIGEEYFFVNKEFAVDFYTEENDDSDENFYNLGNYFNNEEAAGKMAFKTQLMFKLCKWRAEHDNVELDWNDGEEYKYEIFYDYKDKQLKVGVLYVSRTYNSLYFSSKEIAHQCIDEFHDDLVKYFTEI